MAQFTDILSPLTRLDPGELISQYEEWIIFTLLIFLFWSIIGISLRKRFQESRFLRILTTTLAIMMAVGVYYSIYIGWLHFSLQSLGMFGVILLFIVIFFILYGLIKGYGVKTWNALPLGFALFYISIYAVAPNVLDTIADRFALVNLILFILFIASAVKTVTGFFHHSKDPARASKSLLRNRIKPQDEPEIEKEIEFEKQERKQIKTRTLKITKQEIKDLDKIKHYLEDMIDVLEESDNLTEHQKQHIGQSLLLIADIKHQFVKGLKAIENHIDRYSAGDEQKVQELKKRYHATNDNNKKQQIQKEYMFEEKKIHIFDFWRNHSGKINNFLLIFDKHINTAVELMKQNNPKEAVGPIKSSLQYLDAIHDVLKKLKSYEKYILKLSKKEQKTQEKEKTVISV